MLYRGVCYIESHFTSTQLFEAGPGPTMDVFYIEVYGISRCMVYQGVRYIEVYGISRCMVCRGVRYIEVYGISKCMVYRGVWYIEV